MKNLLVNVIFIFLLGAGLFTSCQKESLLDQKDVKPQQIIDQVKLDEIKQNLLENIDFNAETLLAKPIEYDLVEGNNMEASARTKGRPNGCCNIVDHKISPEENNPCSYNGRIQYETTSDKGIVVDVSQLSYDESTGAWGSDKLLNDRFDASNTGCKASNLRSFSFELLDGGGYILIFVTIFDIPTGQACGRTYSRNLGFLTC